MNDPEIDEMLDFSLAMNEWAVSQPGYKSPVTEADVEKVISQIRPVLKSLQQRSSEQTKEEYEALKIIWKNPFQHKPRMTIFIEVTGGKPSKLQKIIEAIQQKKLVDIKGDRFEVTELGHRFIREYDEHAKT